MFQGHKAATGQVQDVKAVSFPHFLFQDNMPFLLSLIPKTGNISFFLENIAYLVSAFNKTEKPYAEEMQVKNRRPNGHPCSKAQKWSRDDFYKH